MRRYGAVNTINNFLQSFSSQDCKLMKHMETVQEFHITIPAKVRCFGPTNSTDSTTAVINIPPWNIPERHRSTIKHPIFGEKLEINAMMISAIKLGTNAFLRPNLNAIIGNCVLCMHNHIHANSLFVIAD